MGLFSVDLPNLVIDCGLVDLLQLLADLVLSFLVRLSFLENGICGGVAVSSLS